MFLPNDEIPRNFRCPVTLDIMEDPVKADDNYTYERDAITSWMAEHSNRSPMTKQVLSTNLIPNTNLKNDIDRYFRRKNTMLTIYVKDMSNRNVIITIDENKKLSQFKQEVSKKNGVKVDEMNLVYLGKPLKNLDNKTLKELKIQNETTINLLYRGEGGF